MKEWLHFKGGPVIRVSWHRKHLSCVREQGDVGSIPGLGRSPGVGNGNPLQQFSSGESHGQRSLAGYGS